MFPGNISETVNVATSTRNCILPFDDMKTLICNSLLKGSGREKDLRNCGNEGGEKREKKKRKVTLKFNDSAICGPIFRYVHRNTSMSIDRRGDLN
jgi:hypothetical protein